MAKRTLEEQIQAARDKIKNEQNHLNDLLKEHKDKERKIRTKRLIDRGAILESLIDGAAELTNDQIAELIKTALGSSNNEKIVAETKSTKVEQVSETVSAPSAEIKNEGS